MLETPSLRHCSNKYKLAKEAINKDKYFFISQVMTEEMSLLENLQGFSIPDDGGKFIPPARNSE